jgi:hypothetical protein
MNTLEMLASVCEKETGFYSETDIIHRFSEQEFLCFIDIEKLGMCHNWKWNRPPCEKKVNEIKEELLLNPDYVLSELYIASVGGEWVCYDGFHRMSALMCIKSHPPPPHLKKILVHIRLNTNDDFIKKRFIQINKTTPVPELYTDFGFNHLTTENETLKLNQDIERIVDYMCKTYKPFVSNSINPQRPNFNKNKLTNDLYRYCKTNKFNAIDFEKFIDRLSEINIRNQNRVEQLQKYMSETEFKRMYPESVLKKSKKYNVWLFIDDLGF